MEEDIFERLRFFKGFFTQAEDWETEQSYHVEKRKLQKRALYSPGIVSNYGEELKVKAKGKFSFEVRPGYAIDGNGNDIIVSEPIVKTIEKKNIQVNKPVYISIKYKEKFCEPQRSEEPAYQQQTRIKEGYEIIISNIEPDMNTFIELARIYLSEDAYEIKDTKGRSAYQNKNVIDLRFIRRVRPLLKALGCFSHNKGNISVEPEQESFEHLDTISAEAISKGIIPPFYVVNVYPEDNTGKGIIKWWIAVNRSADNIEYRLYFHNSSDKPIKVSYVAYAL